MDLTTVLTAKHLLILCCYGSTPCIDLHTASHLKQKHKSTHTVDPTDWIAEDISGSELNLSMINALRPELYVPSQVTLSSCDLFNLTFSDIQDEELFERSKGEIKCRCPVHRTGLSCELEASEVTEISDFSFINVISSVFLVVTLGTFVIAIMKCAFCNCFGGTTGKKDDLDAPLDQNTLNRCLELVRAHEARQNILLKSSEHQRPLITTVSETCTPYRGAAFQLRQPPYNPNYQEANPPPPYRSVQMEQEQPQLHHQQQHDQLQSLLGNACNTRI